MAKKLRSRRRAAARQQFNLCFYCSVPMWEQDPPSQLLQITKSIALADRLRCTVEHLDPRSDGGSDDARNIVAACAFCNQTRHRAKRPLAPNKYRLYVRARMMKGRWHPELIHRFVIAEVLK